MNINNYIVRKLPSDQKIMRVPLHKKPVPSVSEPVDPTSYDDSISPDHKNENSLAYCNTLPPAPRSQLTNYPPRSTFCPNINPIPYTKNSCYLVNNRSQGVVGLVCNNAGGSNNSNFVRGNEFGQDYLWINQYEYENDKKKEYTIEQPVQVPLEMKNPDVAYNRSNFYPYGGFFNRQYPWYRTYPQFKNYTADGTPIYTYPYKTLNPIKGKDVVEGFQNSINHKTLVIPVILMIVIFIICFCL